MIDTPAFFRRSCPCCGSEPPKTPSVSAPQRAENLDYETLKPFWMGFFKAKTFFSYSRCASCGLLFAPQFFNATQLENLYAQMPPNMDVVSPDILRRTQKGYFDFFKVHSNLRGRFLEIGPDVGLFTENCVRDGHFEKYWLFEPNRDVATALESLMSGKNVSIVHDMFGFQQVPDHSIDAAVMIHVFDHLLDPVATASDLRRKMRPGSKLLIVTHDEGSALRYALGWRWPAFCLQHPELYNKRTIARVLDKAGFAIVAQEKTVNYFPVSFLLRQGLWALGIKADAVPSFADRAIGLRLGNILTIAEPKNHP